MIYIVGYYPYFTLPNYYVHASTKFMRTGWLITGIRILKNVKNDFLKIYKIFSKSEKKNRKFRIFYFKEGKFFFGSKVNISM